MQYKPDQYDPTHMVEFMALTVKNPYASWIADGTKTIEVRSKPTKYRGRLLIGASAKPIIDGMQSGCTVALVTLYDCIPVKDMTTEQWLSTRINRPQHEYIEQYGWMLKDVQAIVEFPMRGQLGIFRTCFDKTDIVIYPKKVVLDMSIDELQKVHKKVLKERMRTNYFSTPRRIMRKAKLKFALGMIKISWPLWLLLAIVGLLLWFIL